MSPQHWSQEASDNVPDRDGTWCATYNDRVVLQWSQSKFKKTINIDPKQGNVATMKTEGGTTKYKQLRKLIDNATVMYDAMIDEHSQLSPTLDTDDTEQHHQTPTITPTSAPGIDDEVYEPSCNWDDISAVHHEGNGVLSISGLDNVEVAGTASTALLEWHMRFGHMPFSRLQLLAKTGILSRRLANCQIPICASCMYGKLSRKPWRYRHDTVESIKETTVVGECVSVGQMETHVHGLIGLVKGIPTRARYQVATVFIDHASDYTYVYLQTNTSSVQTLAAKMEFERHASSIGIRIQQYHADNCRFIDNAWSKHLIENNQAISLCGVNAHHQNGRVEKRIRDLQDLARSSILHAQNLWPDAITTNLWPYAVRKAANDLNYVKGQSATHSPMERFANVAVNFRARDVHTFGCPMYVLQGTGVLRAKWATRARLAVYLGPSMNHARSIGLALSLQTGLVSPVFHAKYDDRFQTVGDSYGKYVTKSQWQVKCGFTKGNSSMRPG
jgi:GAG-pre-integrase domain